MKVWDVAVVGCGDISGIYFDNMINRFDNLRVVACCSKHGVSAKKSADRYGIEAMSLRDILGDPRIEVIVNLTSPAEHYGIVKAALLSGKHVYTEKVMAATYEQARELAQIAGDKGLMLGCAPDTYLGAGIRTAREAVEDGLIGEVTGCAAVLNRNNGELYDRLPFLIQPGAGIGFDVGIYYITAFLSILGPVAAVSGRVNTREPLRMNRDPGSPGFGKPYRVMGENIMCGILEFRSGVLGTVLFNGNCIFPEIPYVAMQGTKGVLYLPDPNTFGGKVVLRTPEHERELPLSGRYADNSRGLGVSQMMRSFEAGEKTDRSMAMAIHSIEILEGIVKSSRTKEHVILTSSFRG